MTWDHEHGCEGPGEIGVAQHVGEPLTVAQIRALLPGTRIVVTWAGGNGPHEGVVVDDLWLGASYTNERESGPHALLCWPHIQSNPLNRVTVIAEGKQ